MVGRFLRQLHSGPVLWLLAVAAGIGAASILLDFGLPWTPVALVVLYVLPLVVAQSKYDVRHSSTTKDSPYFLGFSFTLLALVAVFQQIGGSVEGVPPVPTESDGFLLRGAAAALLTTIFGLAGRQVLYATDPLEEGADDLLQEHAEALRKNARQLAGTQTELLKLVGEFSKSRAEALAEEEKVAGGYLKNLGKVAVRLSDLSGELSGTLSGNIEQISEAARSASEESEKALCVLRSSHAEVLRMAADHATSITDLSSRFEGAGSNLKDSIGRLGATLSESTMKLSSQIEASGAEVANASRSLLEPIQSLGSTVDSVRAQVQQTRDALASLPPSVQAVSDSLDGIPSRVDNAVDALAAVPSRMREVTDDLATKTLDQHQVLADRFQSILGDLQAIDTLVDQVVKVLERRLPPVA